MTLTAYSKNIASILRLSKPMLETNNLIKFEVPSESIKNELDNMILKCNYKTEIINSYKERDNYIIVFKKIL